MLPPQLQRIAQLRAYRTIDDTRKQRIDASVYRAFETLFLEALFAGSAYISEYEVQDRSITVGCYIANHVPNWIVGDSVYACEKTAKLMLASWIGV